MRRARRTAGMLTLATLAAILATGCAAEQPDSSAPEPVSSEGSSAPVASEGDDAPEETSTASVEHYTADDAIASQDVPVPGSAEDTLTVGVHSLTVEGDVQVLRLLLTPHFASVDEDAAVAVRDMWAEDLFVPQLVDLTNLKVYSPIRDDLGRWTSDVFASVANGGTVMAWAVFAAPEDDIDTIDVRVHDSWPEFTDVPITR